MRYIEKITDAGVLLKINLREGYYSIYKSNKPIINTTSNMPTTFFSLQRVIFVGDLFKEDFSVEKKLGFFSVSNKQIIIPFKILEMSDIRHLKLSTDVPLDILPVNIYYFKDLNIGVYLNALKTGIQYFILEPRFERKQIIALKQAFPYCRVIIYQDDIDFMNTESKSNESIQNIDSELIEKGEIALLSKNILFSARLFLLKKQWRELFLLSYKLPVFSLESQLISSYLEIEIKLIKKNNNKNDDDSLIELIKLKKLYDALKCFLSLEKKKVDMYLSQNFIDTEFIEKIEVIIHSKKQSLGYMEVSDQVQRSFYDYVSLKLKERTMEIENLILR